jgi:large subunit ribosomal protein L11
MIIKLLVDGGEMKPGPSIAQQIGPLGINLGSVISEVNKATQEFKGIKVPVELDVDKKTKKFTVKTFSPPTSELIRRELKLEKGSNDHKNIKVGNASIEDIIKIAKIKLPNMLEKDLKKAVKSILGTSASMGILVEDKEPNELIKEVERGLFEKEIKEEKTETNPNKRKELNESFIKLKGTQEEKLKQQQKAEEVKEAEKKDSKDAALPTTATPATKDKKDAKAPAKTSAKAPVAKAPAKAPAKAKAKK